MSTAIQLQLDANHSDSVKKESDWLNSIETLLSKNKLKDDQMRHLAFQAWQNQPKIFVVIYLILDFQHWSENMLTLGQTDCAHNCISYTLGSQTTAWACLGLWQWTPEFCLLDAPAYIIQNTQDGPGFPILCNRGVSAPIHLFSWPEMVWVRCYLACWRYPWVGQGPLRLFQNWENGTRLKAEIPSAHTPQSHSESDTMHVGTEMQHSQPIWLLH